MDIYQKCIEKALKLISKKRYTSAEIDQKLRKFVGKLERLNEGLSFTSTEVDETVKKVIDRLFELKYLDDDRYAEDYVNDRVQFKPRGKFMLRQELKMKGIDKDQIEKVVEDVDESKMTNALLEKKMTRWETQPLNKQREKAFRFLASKGFSPDAIYKAIESHYNRNS